MNYPHHPMKELLRAFVLFALAALLLRAAPPLTPIQDTLSAADGSKFTGTVTISWDAFTATDGSTVPAGRKLVSVINGLFRTQLIPYNGYTADYQSMRGVLSREYWGVAVSVLPVRLADLRAAPLAPFTFSIGTITQLPAGSAFTVSNSGTPTNVVLNFGVPASGPAPAITWDSLTAAWDTYTAAWDSYQ